MMKPETLRRGAPLKDPPAEVTEGANKTGRPVFNSAQEAVFKEARAWFESGANAMRSGIYRPGPPYLKLSEYG